MLYKQQYGKRFVRYCAELVKIVVFLVFNIGKFSFISLKINVILLRKCKITVPKYNINLIKHILIIVYLLVKLKFYSRIIEQLSSNYIVINLH